MPQVFTLPPVAAYRHRLVFDLYPAAPVDPLEALIAERLRDANGPAAASAPSPAPATARAPAPAAEHDPLGDLIAQESTPGPDLDVLDHEARDRLNALVSRLDERSADIIRSRYGLVDGRQHKLADIGVKHGISAERVRQLEREALNRLRRLGDPDLAA